jgi:release factor glutamine methyltransferase
MLAGALREEPAVKDGDVLDLCTGSGAVAIAAALAGARRVRAADVSLRAVLAARLNAVLNGVHVKARRGDLLDAVPGERFDVVASNPPYLPAASDELPSRGLERAWDAGLDGRVLLDRILDKAPSRLRPGGALIVVHSSVCGEEATLERMRAAGLQPDVVERRRGPLGPLLAARARELERRRLIAPGVREEDLLVIRGRRPQAGAEPPARRNPDAAAAGDRVTA